MDHREIFQRIAAEAEKGSLAFPTHAEVALKVQRALDDPDCSTEHAAKLIIAEPMLATRIVSMANSVVYNRSGREVTDVKAAVARLGFRTVRSLAAALVVRQMSGGPTDPKLKAMAAQLWEHTAHVAALAHAVARHVTRVDAETALFAGLIHEVAGFYLLSRAKDFPGLFDGDAADWIATWNGECEAQVGRAVIRVLGVPEAVQHAIEAYWQGYLALPPVSLGDTLLLAEELCPVASPLFDPEASPADASRHADIELSLGEQTLSGILQESADEVHSITDALKF